MIVDQEDYLVHHGVKGQRWGVRRRRNSEGKTNHQLNKEFKKSEKQRKIDGIDTARKMIAEGDLKGWKRDALKNYFSERRENGSKAARAMLKNRIAFAHWKKGLAKSPKNGREFIAKMAIAGATAITVSYIMKAATNGL